MNYEVDKKDCEGRSAIHYAAMHGHLSVLWLLASYVHSTIPSKLGLDHVNLEGLTPLDHAFKNENGEAAAILRFYGASKSKTKVDDYLETGLSQCLSLGFLNDSGNPEDSQICG